MKFISMNYNSRLICLESIINDNFDNFEINNFQTIEQADDLANVRLTGVNFKKMKSETRITLCVAATH